MVDKKEQIYGELSLYGLTEEGLRLEDLIEKSIDLETGEISEEYEGLVDLQTQLEYAIVNKSKNIIYLLRKKENFLLELGLEIERLSNLKKKYIKFMDSLNNMTKGQMLKLGVEKIETPIGNLVIKKNPPKVEIYDESLIDTKFIKKKVTETTSISKTDIKNAIKSGEEVQGATLIQETKLVIK